MFAEVLHENVYRAFRERLSEFLNVPIDATDSDINDMIDSVLSADRIKTFCELAKIPPRQLDQIIPLKTPGHGTALDS